MAMILTLSMNMSPVLWSELFPDTAEVDIDFVPVAAWVEFLDGFCFDLAGGGYRESYHVDEDFEVVFVVHLKVEY